MRKKSKTKNDVTVTSEDRQDRKLLPPVSSFTFISYYWDDKRSANRKIVIAALLAFAVIFVVSFLALGQKNRASDLQAQEAALLDQQQRILTDTNTLTGGIEDLPEHLRTRRNEILDALSHDINVNAIATTIRKVVPAGVDIRSISISEDATALPPAAVAEDEDSALPAVATPQSASPSYTIQLALGTDDITQLRPIVDGIETIPGISPNITFYQTASSGEYIQVSITATIDGTVLQSRRFIAASEYARATALEDTETTETALTSDDLIGS